MVVDKRECCGGLPRSPAGGREEVLRAPYSGLWGGSSRTGCLIQAAGT